MKTLTAILAFFLILAGFTWMQFLHGRTDPTDETPELITSPLPQSPMVVAANEFLESLAEEQLAAATFPFQDEERENWNFTPHPHKGVVWKTLNEEQRARVTNLLQTALSEFGHEKTQKIMELERTLRRLEKRPPNDEYRDPERYYLAIFGTPAEKSPWGWRFEGHHISLNFSSVTGKLSVTPAFLGANPAKVPEGPTKGLRVLAQEEDLARRLLTELSAQQRRQAIIAEEAPADIITGNQRTISLARFEGLAYADMTADQRFLLEQLIRVYLDNMKPRIAQHQWQRMEDAGLDKLHFAWAGSAEPGQAHYYRIHGPTFLVEYDNTQNNANHIHTVWRDPANDFGRDLLREHYESGHSHREE